MLSGLCDGSGRACRRDGYQRVDIYGSKDCGGRGENEQNRDKES